MAEYFFELLTEEIPAWMHDAATATLNDRLSKLVSEVGVDGQPGSVCVYSTPRRIIFLLTGLPVREADREQEIKGPPKKSAFDSEGNPTQALAGFLKKQNATNADLIDSPDDYVRIRRTVEGRATSELLQQRIPGIIESLRWPKMMRWGTGEYSYIRPIHGVVSVFDGTHLPTSIFGVTSGTTTTGHRTLSRKTIEVASCNDLVTGLELERVVVDPIRRRQVMIQRARQLANEVGGTPSVDAAIWLQWQYLTEYPGLVRAEFRREYLALPEEVLVTVMRVHQKQLPIRTEAGALTNFFLAVLDNDGDPDGNAAYGNSFVTNARFADAQFFYETDRKKKLAERMEQLEHLQFQEKLGNYRAKTDRIAKIAVAICAETGVVPDDVATAASLCKADLVTEMVKEFTDLQGQIGGIYAREEGLPAEVWQAIYDHYLPVNADDALPRGLTGAIVSLADRLDTLAGFFRIGAKPTGSKDPFALRRAAQGAVQILLNRDKREVRIGVDRLVDLALEAHGATGNTAVRDDLMAFLAERVRTILETSAWNFAYDEVAAAMEAGWSGSLIDLVERIQALKTVRPEPNFLSILDSVKRIENITAGHTSTEVDGSLLEIEAEKRLASLADLVGAQISEMIADRRYGPALQSFAAMAPELEAFFKDVMVMVDDEKVRSNRMSLLRKIGLSVAAIGDLTKIVVARSDYRA
ncbi:MAG: glycine--tRNA ligase subunit beta [Thermoanaerobaculia bacterium]